MAFLLRYALLGKENYTMKATHFIFRILTAFALIVMLATCSGEDSLVGTYAIKQNGKLSELVRIERSGNEYAMFGKESGQWEGPVKVTPVDKTKLEAILREPVSVSFAGLGNDKVAIFKMPAGWRSRKFETKTGYWLATWGGPVELHKQ